MKDTTTKDTTMRQKNTPTLTKGIVTNHMTTTMKAIPIITKVITMRLMTIHTMATIMTKMVIIPKATLLKAITMQKKPTNTMLMRTKVIATMHTTTATTMEAIRMKSSLHLTRPRQQV